MMKFLKNKKIILPLVIAGTLISITAFAEPGTDSDPLISLSYFNNKIEELKSDLLKNLTATFTEKFNGLEKNVTKQLNDISENGVPTPNSFKVITLQKNETIICEEGTEIIVRSGKCIVVTDKESSGGISDITSGKDLANNTTISNNHLLLVPRSDKRGIKATATGAVMIKGNYEKLGEKVEENKDPKENN